MRLTFAVVLGVLLLAMAAATAQAAFPGKNGKIAFMRFNFESGQSDIWAVNADGTNLTNLTNTLADDAGVPAWSPDGTKIAFAVAAFSGTDIWTMNADGTDPTPVFNGPNIQASPAWSPDGTQIAFVRRHDDDSYDIYTMNADGTNPTNLTNTSSGTEGAPAWSPDGTKIAFTQALPMPGTFNTQFEIFTMNADGTNRVNVSDAPESDDYAPNWSPDGAKIAFHSTRDQTGFQIYTMNRDGTNPTRLTETFGTFPAWSPDGTRIAYERGSYIWLMDADGTNRTQLTTPLNIDEADRFADWQPLPINAYPRPKGASPMQVSLVPAYQPCASPNRTHGPPLAFPSCTPPQRTPGQLTIGTADSNQRPTKSVSIVQIGVRPGIPSTAADEADLRLFGTVNDVRVASDLSDYTGQLEARMSVQITDKDNTPHPGGPGAGTVQELTYSFPIPCAATSDPTVGGDCTFETTAEAFAPGLVKELRRSVWELGSLRVYDGAGGLFMTQGIFVP